MSGYNIQVRDRKECATIYHGSKIVVVACNAIYPSRYHVILFIIAPNLPALS